MLLEKKQNVRKNEEKLEKPIKAEKLKPERTSKERPLKKPAKEEPPLRIRKEPQKSKPSEVKRVPTKEAMKPVKDRTPVEPPNPKPDKSPKAEKLPKPKPDRLSPVIVSKKSSEKTVKFTPPMKKLKIKHPKKTETKRKEEPIR